MCDKTKNIFFLIYNIEQLSLSEKTIAKKCCVKERKNEEKSRE